MKYLNSVNSKKIFTCLMCDESLARGLVVYATLVTYLEIL